MFGFAIAAILLGGAVQAYSAYQAGQAQSAMASANADIAQQNAALTQQKKELLEIEKNIAEKRHRKKMDALLGSQRVAYGKGGVELSGTPLIVGMETAAEAEVDALAIRYASSAENARLISEQSSFRHEAELQKIRGDSARNAGILGAGSSLLSSFGQAYMAAK